MRLFEDETDDPEANASLQVPRQRVVKRRRRTYQDSVLDAARAAAHRKKIL